jgi:hypothetical protein
MAVADALATFRAKAEMRFRSKPAGLVTGQDSLMAAVAINRVVDAVRAEKAVHFCFGNYTARRPTGTPPRTSIRAWASGWRWWISR